VVIDPYKLRKRFKAAAHRAGVRPVRFHDLRHTFGTQMAAVGAPLRAIQEWMGHSDYRTTSIYADFALDPNQGARYAEQALANPRLPARLTEDANDVVAPETPTRR
jgi:integrase